ADLDLELLVDQLLDYVLPDRRLVGGKRVEFRALLDVVVRNDFAVDDQHDVLGERSGRCHNCGEDAGHRNDDAILSASFSAPNRAPALSSLLNVGAKKVRTFIPHGSHHWAGVKT